MNMSMLRTPDILDATNGSFFNTPAFLKTPLTNGSIEIKTDSPAADRNKVVLPHSSS
jgi:hypothetical protein